MDLFYDKRKKNVSKLFLNFAKELQSGNYLINMQIPALKMPGITFEETYPEMSGCAEKDIADSFAEAFTDKVYAAHKFFSFKGFQNQLKVHNRWYISFLMRPSGRVYSALFTKFCHISLTNSKNF